MKGKDLILKDEREVRSKPIRIESVNTGRIWGFDKLEEIDPFMFGRNRKSYKIMVDMQWNAVDT